MGRPEEGPKEGLEEGLPRELPTPSLQLALGLLAGVVAAQVLPRPGIGAAVALAGLALALPRGQRSAPMGLAVGLVLGWCGLEGAPARIDLGRPVVVTARQLGDWRLRAGQVEGETRGEPWGAALGVGDWSTAARIETVRQGAAVARWGVDFRLSLPGGTRPPGRRWRLRGYLVRPAPLANGGPGRAPSRRLRVKSSRLLERLAPASRAGRLADALAGLRSDLRAALGGVAADRPGSRLARALALGERGALPESWVRGLRRSGTVHVVALSGLHLSVVAGWCALASRRLGRRRRFFVLLLGTLAYLALGGPRPGLIRAWIMVAAAGASTVFRRRARPAHALVWAAAVLALLEPRSVLDLGFQLTFAATAGVLLGARLLPLWWPVVPRTLAAALGASIGAQIATIPFTLPAFHWLPVWAWLWNLAIVPAVAVAVPLSLAWSALALASPAAAVAALPPLDLLAGWLALPSRLPAGFGGGVPWGAGGVPLAGSLVALLVLSRWPRCWLPAACAAALLFAPGRSVRARAASVRLLDVGQGDALLIHEGRRGLLVDGGGWRGPGVAETALLPTLGALGLRRLEVVVLSHGDRDHCRGLLELAGYVAIGEVWLAPGTARSGCGRHLALTAGARLRPLWEGERAAWRSWRFRALNPPPGRGGRGNEDSLVLHGESRGRSLLLTGDIGSRTERRILRRAAAGRAAVSLLKVAHHGSASSSSLSFLRAVRPRLAVISAGRANPFGHPAPKVLARLSSAGIPVLRTDRSGAIAVHWKTGRGWHVSTPGAGR